MPFRTLASVILTPIQSEPETVAPDRIGTIRGTIGIAVGVGHPRDAAAGRLGDRGEKRVGRAGVGELARIGGADMGEGALVALFDAVEADLVAGKRGAPQAGLDRIEGHRLDRAGRRAAR